jgi:uncharacterized membrane protein HdeD (DUF308 family)
MTNINQTRALRLSGSVSQLLEIFDDRQGALPRARHCFAAPTDAQRGTLTMKSFCAAAPHQQEEFMDSGKTGSRSGMFILEASQADAMSAVLAQNWWALAVRGALGIAVGLITLVLPAATMLALVLLFAAYMLVDGVFAIIAAVRAARQHERWGLLTLAGAADIIAGGVAVLWPGITVLAFVLLVGAWAIVSGSLILVAGFRLNLEHGRWWLVLAGAASVIYGVLLLVAPMIGALVLTWWFGAYALIFGILLLVLAFRLKARHDRQSHPAVAQGAT